MPCYRLAAAAAALIAPWPAAAEPGPLPEPGDAVPIIVTAAPFEERLSDSGQAVSVFTSADIARLQTLSVADLVTRAPGVTLSRNGAPGGFASLSVRGAPGDELLVLVDGVKVNDPAAPAGGYDFAGLLTGGIGRVELLRGANSLVWGSQALAGVLAVESSRAAGLSASVEGGSRSTLAADASLGLRAGPAELALSAGRFSTAGFSSAANGSEPDGFRQWHATGRASLPLGPVRLTLGGRYARARADLDGFPPPDYLLADTADHQRLREWSGYGRLDYSPGGGLRASASYAIADTARESYDPAFGPDPSYASRGRTERLRAVARLPLVADVSADLGAEHELSRFATAPFGSRASTAIDALFAVAHWRPAGLSLNAGLRWNRHRQFGTHWTPAADAAVAIGPGWRLRASYGGGFKAPTLFQLLSDYGNPALRPERATSYDLGLERQGRHFRAALTLFGRDTRDLIDFVSCYASTRTICNGRPYGTYDNVGRTRARGVEAEVELKPTPALTARLAYGLVEAVNRTPGSADFGRQLARRPEQSLSAALDWTPSGARFAPSLGAELRLVSDSFDDPANRRPLDGYALLDLRASLALTPRIELFGRIENVTDARYQTALGYGSAPRGVFVGLRMRP